MDVDVLVARFYQTYGHTDFRDEQATREEYAYKRGRGRKMREWLSREALRQLIERENWAEVCQRVIRSFSMSSGPLARWDEYQWVRELNAEEQRRFVLALEEFLYGEGPFLKRLEGFVAEVTDVYLRFRDRDPVPKYKAKKLSWPFVSYFHFMMWPDQEYAFVKPTPLSEASRVAGFDIQYDSHPNRNTYARVQEFYRALWPTVQELGGRDWIDVQTLIHVAGEGFGPPDGGWDDWRAKLREWLRENPTTMPDRLRQLRQEFVRRFPKEGLTDLTLEQYALGHKDSRNSFCYWLEFETHELGRLGGDARKFGVWWGKEERRWKWNKSFDCGSPEEALSQIRAGLSRLVGAVEAGEFDRLDSIGAETLGPRRYSLRAKALYLYFPDEFLPISSTGHLAHFLGCFGQQARGDLHACNRQLLQHLRSLHEFDGLDTRQMMRFLYDSFPPNGTVNNGPKPPSSLSSILAYIADSPHTFSPQIVTNYHLSLLTKPFVILTGLSGTGKTLLTRLYADAAYDIEEGEANPYYAIVAVRPDWTDNRGLLGYYNPLTRTYEATPFVRFMLRAAADPAHDYYVCLDEMNLARVEYYFSDFLSALESEEAVELHTHEESVATQAGEGIPLTLPEEETRVRGYAVDGVLYVPSRLHIPSNLFVSGTVNVDETTYAFSDKVLDRANSIEFNRVDLAAYERRYREGQPDRAELLDKVMPLLRQLYQLLEPRYLHFGYRTLDEVLAYLWHNETLDESVRQSRVVVLDNQVMQKILPKLRGDERILETLEGLLDTLKVALGEESRSVAKLRWMLEELKAFGSTQFWR